MEVISNPSDLKYSITSSLSFLLYGVNKQSLIDYSKKVVPSIKISFKGCLPRNTAIEHMLEADVFISLSKGEGLPIAVLEAMYCGCFLFSRCCVFCFLLQFVLCYFCLKHSTACFLIRSGGHFTSALVPEKANTVHGNRRE